MYWLCKLSLQNSFRNSPKVSNSLDLDLVIISYSLIKLKTCIPNGTANLLFWHTHLIPYSMQVNSKGTDETEQKNIKMTQSNAQESIEMVGIFLFIWYSDVQYASIFILWWGQRILRVALVVTGTYCELLTCISVVVSVVGGVKGI